MSLISTINYPKEHQKVTHIFKQECLIKMAPV